MLYPNQGLNILIGHFLRILKPLRIHLCAPTYLERTSFLVEASPDPVRVTRPDARCRKSNHPTSASSSTTSIEQSPPYHHRWKIVSLLSFNKLISKLEKLLVLLLIACSLRPRLQVRLRLGLKLRVVTDDIRHMREHRRS